MASNDITPISYYEEGTGTYGDARNLIFTDPPEDFSDEAAVDEHFLTDRMNSVSFGDIIEALRDARDRRGDYLAVIDFILAVIDNDPEED